MDYQEQESRMILHFPDKMVAVVEVSAKSDYVRFELISLESRHDIQAIVWGPYPTTIQDKIGETICVVRNDEFSIGMQSLDINTIEGIPDDGDDAGGGFFIDPLPGQQLPDSLKDKVGAKVQINVNIDGDMPDYVRLYRGSAAVKTPYGSEIRLFSRDRRIPRIIGGIKDRQYVEPIDVDFQGSAIALFGCPEPKTLDVIEQIELGENLPHPVFNGAWIKRSSRIGEAYLLNEGDPEQVLKYARACGFKLAHIGDVFQSWGHFGLKTRRFQNGAEDIQKFTDKAHKDSISIGVHTLTMFTTTNDPYVSPVPSDSLCKAGSTLLSKIIGPEDSMIYINDPTYFINTGSTHTVKIDKELIAYRKVSDDQPWRLLDCRRGQFGTKISAHQEAAMVDKLINDSYNGFYPDIHLQDKYALRLARVCNATGIDLMDFDGFGGGSPTGHGCYGAARFIDMWYKNLDRYRLTCGAGTFHYYWHIYAFMNWGEPWYNDLRQSQVNYRIENQRYFERNLMSGMLGWFTLNPEFRLEDVEWIQARSAGFDAGYLLRVDQGIEENGFKEQLFESIREWQKARKAKAFGPKIRERLENPKNEFHLERAGDGVWNLYPIFLSNKFEHQYRMVQTGEPIKNSFNFINPNEEQPLQFYAYIEAYEANAGSRISKIHLDVNDYQSLDINQSLVAGDRLYCDGKDVYLCNKTWGDRHILPDLKIPKLQNGQNNISVQSNFSGKDAPRITFEFKSVGKPEKIEANLER